MFNWPKTKKNVRKKFKKVLNVFRECWVANFVGHYLLDSCRRFDHSLLDVTGSRRKFDRHSIDRRIRQLLIGIPTRASVRRRQSLLNVGIKTMTLNWRKRIKAFAMCYKTKKSSYKTFFGVGWPPEAWSKVGWSSFCCHNTFTSNSIAGGFNHTYSSALQQR